MFRAIAQRINFAGLVVSMGIAGMASPNWTLHFMRELLNRLEAERKRDAIERIRKAHGKTHWETIKDA